MSNLSEIGVNFSTYLASIRPQVIDNSLQWYLAGSLATITMTGAESITEIKLDEENNIEDEGTPKKITEEQRGKIKTFTRKLGGDIDVVNVNGHFYAGRITSISNLKQNVPNLLDLMSWSQDNASNTYIDNLEGDREISYHPVAKVKTPGGYVYVTAPPEQLAHKLTETIYYARTMENSKLSGETVSDSVKSDYQKDIKDVASMFYGFKDLYGKEEFLDRIYLALNDKKEKKALFSIHNPTYNSNNAMTAQKVLETYIMRRIIEDTGQYLRDIADDESDVEISDFFDSLLSRRRSDVERIIREQATHLTPLQQRERQLCLLEDQAAQYDVKLGTQGKNDPNDPDVGEQ